MNFDESLLKYDEKAVFALRTLYNHHGYKQFKMSKFEEYDLYSKNKDFLVSDGVITFTDTDGKLLALKPDVTLSIIKNSKDIAGYTEKYYYSENVYRVSETSHTYKEIMQTGLECIGDITLNNVCEVAELAMKSLALFSEGFMLHISHVGLLDAILEKYGVAEIQGFSNAEEALFALSPICKNTTSIAALEELKQIYELLCSLGYKDHLTIDFSLTNTTGYYSGIVFKGYINGIASRVLSGGQYDKLLKNMGRSSGAAGFAVYLDSLERLDTKSSEGASTETEQPIINIALPKGRLGEKVYNMFEAAGFECPSIKETNRKLIFENQELGLRFFWVKPSDVAIYVERGAADIGVAGKDILLEYKPDVHELLDLNIGKCRMAVASKKDFVDDISKTLRVATKFSNIARTYYNEKCRDIDIIHLNGSIEIAPILNLSDVIVDIVETGKTLLENDLIPYETIVPISARLIANKSAYSFKAKRIEEIKRGLSEQVKD